MLINKNRPYRENSRNNQKNLISLIISCLIILAFDNLSAQNFKGGLRSGIVASEVSGDNLSGASKLGWYAAAFALRPISDFTSFTIEIMYIQKGSRSIPSERNNFYEYKFFLDYAEVPVYINTNIGRFTDLPYTRDLKVKTGLSFSALVNSMETDQGTPVPPEERQPFNRFELNLLLGLSFPLTQTLDFNFGFSNSLTPIRPHSGGGKVWYNRGQYHTLWTFGVALELW